MKPWDGLAGTSFDKRRQIRVGRRRMKRRSPREERRRLSRAELLDYLRRNHFQSRRKLQAGRRPGDPAVWDFVREFGKWSIALTEAFGKEAFAADFSAEYLVKVVAENNLWTVQLFLEGHRVRPDIVPSFYYVKKEFRRWKNLEHFAREYDIRRILSEYLRLKRKLGRIPTSQECKSKEIDCQRLVDLFGGKKNFHENVLSLERQYAKSDRSASETR